MAALQIRVIGKDSDRDELVAALLAVNAEARRTLAKDSVGRPNERWAGQHAFMNMILGFLEAADG